MELEQLQAQLESFRALWRELRAQLFNLVNNCGGGFIAFTFDLGPSGGDYNELKYILSKGYLSALEGGRVLQPIEEFLKEHTLDLLKSASLPPKILRHLRDGKIVHTPKGKATTSQVERSRKVYLGNISTTMLKLEQLPFPFVVHICGPSATAYCHPTKELLDHEFWKEDITNNVSSLVEAPSLFAAAANLTVPRQSTAIAAATAGLKRVRLAGAFDAVATATATMPAVPRSLVQDAGGRGLTWYINETKDSLRYCAPVPLYSEHGTFKWAMCDVRIGKDGLPFVSRIPVEVIWRIREGEVASASCSCTIFGKMQGRCMHVAFLNTYHESLISGSNFPASSESSIKVCHQRQEQNLGSYSTYFYCEQGFVCLDGGKVSCTTHGSSCRHVDAYNATHASNEPAFGQAEVSDSQDPEGQEDEEDDVDDATVEGMAQDANARSKLEYPLPGALYSTLIDRATAGFLGLVTTAPHAAGLCPELPKAMCGCGCYYSPEGYRLLKARPTVYLGFPHGTVQMPLCILQCPNNKAECLVQYDGIHHGLYRYTDATIISLHLLYKAVDRVLGGTSINASHVDVNKDHKPGAVIADALFMSLNTWREALYHFLHRLEMRGTLLCSECGDHPDTLIADGTALTMKSVHYSGTPITTVDRSLPVVGRAHNRRQRAFFDDRLDKVPLAARPSLNCTREHAVTGLIDMSTSMAAGASTFSIGDYGGAWEVFSLSGFIEWVQKVVPLLATRDVNIRKPKINDIVTFIKCLIRDSPAISYFPYSLVEPIQSVLRGATPTDRQMSADLWELIKHDAPQLHAILDIASYLSVSNPKEAIDGDFFGLLNELCQRSELCASGPVGVGPPIASLPASATTDECMRTGICTGLPRLRQRPQYEADGDSSADSTCNHAFPKAGSLTGGIFTIFCKHAVCYAFCIMPSAEGRDELFTFITCYLKECPKVVIYDFGCALQEFFLNRAPGHSKFMKICIDAAHWPNHIACAPSYNAKAFYWMARLNTQAAEQNNNALRTVKRSVTRMAQRPFVMVVRMFLIGWNESKEQGVAYHVAHLACLPC